MNESMLPALADVLEYLLALQQEGVRPREARALLQPLRGRHPDLEIDLLFEQQTFDQSVHYDALLRSAGEGTVSLSYCPERALPWPLRGVHRWNDGDLMRINGDVLSVDAAMACLDFIWDEVSIIERLVNMGLIQEELQRNPIELTDVELQAAMDQFRSAKALFTVEDTLVWLERHGMSQEKLEKYVTESAIVPKLRDRIAADRVEEYFRQHSSDFDTASIVMVDVIDENQASELAEQIRAAKLDFFAAAESCFLASAARGDVPTKNLFAVLERRQTTPSLRDAVFAAVPGQLIGPILGENGYSLVRVLAINPARLDNATRTAIKKVLFDEWLAERRQAVKIEWCWGNASKTG